MKTKITESELSSRSASLREKIAQLESQQTDEGFFDAIKSGWNKLTGGGQPAAAPAPAAAATPGTPAAGVAFNQGKPGEAPQAQAQAAAGPAGAPPKPAANAREQQYNTALKQIKDLYAKAGVQYPPQDDIVRQRYGLPPALPAIAQWDGKMPQSTGADFLTRNLFGRDASKAVAGQQAANNISNTANAKSDAETEADVKQLGTLVAQLKDMLSGKTTVPAVDLSQAANPGTPAAGVAFNQGKAFGGYGQAPAAAPATLAESIARLNKKIRLMETPNSGSSYTGPIGNATNDPAGAPPLDLTGQTDIRKKIQDIMAKINGNNEDPPQDVAQALSDAQAALDQADAAAKKVPAVSLAQDNGVNAQGQNVTITNADGSTTNPETGVTTPPANPMRGVNAQGQNTTIKNADGSTTNPETGEITPAPSAASIISKSPVVQASQSAAAPAKAINPETGEEYTPLAPVATAAAPVAQRKYGGYGQATAESVSYRDDQALARIVQLSRR